MRKRLREWTRNPKFNLGWCVVFGVWDLVDAIRHTISGKTGWAIFNCALFAMMVAFGGYWARRLREQNGGVLWIPKVRLRREGDGREFAWCGNQYVEVIPRPYGLRRATEEVWFKYRDGKLAQRENRKTRRRILKEARRGHRGNATNDPSGATEGAGNKSGGQPPAKEGAITAAGGLCAPIGSITISGVASSGLRNLLTGATHLSFPSVTIATTSDDDTTQPPESDAELDTYTIPVWGFRSWQLLEGGVPKLGSLNSGRHVWTPGVNVAVCQAGDFELRAMSGSCLSVSSPGLHVPGIRCSCGFYAVRDVFDVQPGIIGGVVGWGKVVDGEKGWRVEKAAVAALYRAPWGSVEEQKKVEMLAEMYNVPVCLTLIDLAEKTRELAEWMAGDDLLTGSVDG